MHQGQQYGIGQSQGEAHPADDQKAGVGLSGGGEVIQLTAQQQGGRTVHTGGHDVFAGEELPAGAVRCQAQGHMLEPRGDQTGGEKGKGIQDQHHHPGVGGARHHQGHHQHHSQREPVDHAHEPDGQFAVVDTLEHERRQKLQHTAQLGDHGHQGAEGNGRAQAAEIPGQEVAGADGVDDGGHGAFRHKAAAAGLQLCFGGGLRREKQRFEQAHGVPLPALTPFRTGGAAAGRRTAR